MSTQQKSQASPRIVFVLDVDNTLLDNDRLKSDLAARLVQALGQSDADRFWELYEEIRAEKDYVDYPTTIERWIAESPSPEKAMALRHAVDSIDFRSYLYPHALDTIAYLRTLGTPMVLSDGDPVFQPRKIKESGVEAAVSGNVMVVVHKENELPAFFQRFPADHYVIVDDKARILSHLEQECPATFTTILVRQGKYSDPDAFSPKPDYAVPSIADVQNFTREQFLHHGPHQAREKAAPSR